MHSHYPIYIESIILFQVSVMLEEETCQDIQHICVEVMGTRDGYLMTDEAQQNHFLCIPVDPSLINCLGMPDN